MVFLPPSVLAPVGAVVLAYRRVDHPCADQSGEASAGTGAAWAPRKV
jgi:hypothetical protein